MLVNNRYEFMFYVECINGNPNGDPDLGNSPRVDPQDMHGYITDVAIKRRIRNYIQTAFAGKDGMRIIMQNATNINGAIAEAHEKGYEGDVSKAKEKVYKARQWACENFYDVRTFGAVLSTGPNAGQVRGPVQISFGRSIDSVLPLDITITRMCVADSANGAKTVEDFKKWEDEQDEDSLRTMGRKQFIPYGLYEVRGFVSANLAAETGFDQKDLMALFESILNMYEHDHSASKGQMSVISPLIIFKHVGTDTNDEQKQRQAKLGCVAAHKLFELVKISRKASVEIPRNYRDYICSISMNKVPNGVEVGFISNPCDEITWGSIPSDCDWVNISND